MKITLICISIYATILLPLVLVFNHKLAKRNERMDREAAFEKWQFDIVKRESEWRVR